LDFDLYNSSAQYQGRLVFDPGLLGTVTDDTWQSWNTLTADAWYFTAYNGNGLNNDCSISNSADYCTFATANSYISTDFAVDVLFKAGAGQSSFNGDVMTWSSTVRHLTSILTQFLNPSRFLSSALASVAWQQSAVARRPKRFSGLQSGTCKAAPLN